MNHSTLMRVGTARVDITPAIGCELSGFLARVQPSIGQADRLMLHALYLELEHHQLLWIHADLIGLERDLVCLIKDRLCHEFDLTESEIILTASHTHSGPATIHLIDSGEYDESYVTELPEKYILATQESLQSTELSQLVYGDTTCTLAVDRRGKPSAHTDPLLGVLGWRRPDGSYIAVLANYAMHNVALGPDSRQISADVSGRAAALLRASLPGEPVVLWTNGACGNLDPPKLSSEYAPVVNWGHQLAECAVRALCNASPVNRPCLINRTRDVMFPLDNLDTSIEYVERFIGELTCKAEGTSLFVAKDGHSDIIRQRMLHAARTWLERMQTRVRHYPLPIEMPLALHVVDFGPVIIACFGAEVFSRMAEDLRDLTGSKILVVGYANGESGYLSPAAAYDEGGYEVDVAFMFYEGLRVAQGSFEKVRDQMACLIRDCQQANDGKLD